MNQRDLEKLQIIPPPLRLFNGKLHPDHKILLKQGWRDFGTRVPGRSQPFYEACARFLERSAAQTGSKKPRKKAAIPSKTKATTPEVPVCIPKSKITPPSENVQKYLEFLNNQPTNQFSRRKNTALKKTRKNDQREAIMALNAKPMYELYACNRFYTPGTEWQNLKKSARARIGTGCLQSDLRSLHFEIFMHLIRREGFDGTSKIESLIGGNPWLFFESKGISKSTAKLAILSLINGDSKTGFQRRILSSVPAKKRKKNGNPTIDPDVGKICDFIYAGVVFLKKKLDDSFLLDAFGRKIFPTPYVPSPPWRKRKREHYEIWRTDLNRVYSSFELRIITEVLEPFLTQSEFCILFHLHDGYIWKCNKKRVNGNIRLMEKRAKAILNEIGIHSELVTTRVSVSSV